MVMTASMVAAPAAVVAGERELDSVAAEKTVLRAAVRAAATGAVVMVEEWAAATGAVATEEAAREAVVKAAVETAVATEILVAADIRQQEISPP